MSAPARASLDTIQQEAFPRGGKQLLSSAERKRLVQEGRSQAERDLLFDGGKKRRKQSSTLEAEDDLDFARTVLERRLPKFVELLRFTSLVVGAKVWGCIALIHPASLTVALPDGLQGVVPLAEASEVLSEQLEKASGAGGLQHKLRQIPGAVTSLHAVFQVGQFVRASVVELQERSSGTRGGRRKRVMLSLKVGKLNSGLSKDSLTEGLELPACVRGVEDHGYTLALGIEGVTAFLEKGDHNSSNGLLPGALVEVAITNASDKRMVRVAMAPPRATQSPVQEGSWTTINTLLPGMLVNARVQHILSDGLVLSFLTYFAGTVDTFHLTKEGAMKEEWRSAFSIGQRLRARVLYVEPASKRICLSLLPHLLKAELPHLPSPGTLIPAAVVQRVDPGLGALLDLAAHGTGFAHISDISDEHIDKLEKVLQPGQTEAARVIGSRPLDALAVISLKPSAVEQFLVAGVDVGDTVKGEVVLVDNKGILVNLARNLNAFVPTEHASDVGSEKAKAKHRVGDKVTGRILKVDPARRRMTMTLKKALINSKLKPLASWEDAAVGSCAVGTVDGVSDFGVFVHFYADIKGLIHVSELGLSSGTTPADAHSVGQVLKVRILAVDAPANRIRLSLATTKRPVEPTAETAALLGGTGTAVVTAVLKDKEGAAPKALEADVLMGGRLVGRGRLEPAHLSDHPSAAAALLNCSQIGSNLGHVVLLRLLNDGQTWQLSRKKSLVSNAALLPKSLEDLVEGQIYAGHVANVTGDSVFVSFANGLTGRAGLVQLADTFVQSAHDVFSAGQSVRAQVQQVNKEKQQFSVSLKRSLTGDTTAILTATFFEDMEAAGSLKALIEAAEGEPATDWGLFPIGGRTQGSVHQLKEYGMLVDLDDDPNIIGFVPTHQAGQVLEMGGMLKARILDVNKRDGIVDLTTQAKLVEAGEATSAPLEQHSPQVGAVVYGEVQLLRDEYAVVTLASCGHMPGFVGLRDFNMQDPLSSGALVLHSIHKFSVLAPPSDETGGRLILQLLRKRGRQHGGEFSRLQAGAIVEGTVLKITPMELVVALLEGLSGRVHITEVADESPPAANPLAKFRPGAAVKAVVLGLRKHGKKRRGRACMELSLRPSALAAAAHDTASFDMRVHFRSVRLDGLYTGFVAKVATDAVFITVGPKLTGRAALLDTSADPARLTALSDHLAEAFEVGQPVQCRVLKADSRLKRLDLSLVLQPPPMLFASTSAAAAGQGALLMGRIARIKGTGVLIQLGSSLYGKAQLLELHDSWVKNALHGLQRGMCVRCRVIRDIDENRAEAAPQACTGDEEDASAAANAGRGDGQTRKRKRSQGCRKLDGLPRKLLTLKASLGGIVPCWTAEEGLTGPEPILQLTDITAGLKVQGYVADAGQQGVFVTIGNGLDARVKLSNLADYFVPDVAAAFPIGKLVRGTVVACDPDKNSVEVSLKAEGVQAAVAQELSQLQKGQIVAGKVSSIHEFGAFVTLQNMQVVGLIHKSAVADAFVSSVADHLKIGQGVQAKVLSIDLEKQRLRLGTKPSYFAQGSSDDAEGSQGSFASALDASNDQGDAGSEGSPDLLQAEPATAVRGNGDAGLMDLDAEASDDNSDSGASEDLQGDLLRPGASASRPAEEDADFAQIAVGWGDEPESAAAKAPQEMAGAATGVQKQASKQCLELQKRGEEQAVTDPLSVGIATGSMVEFEKELTAAPDSSHTWIRYMAFMVRLGEVGKARAVAERALATIGYRHEGEKLNVWVAWLKLELEHAEAPETAAMQLFQKALSYNDQKKLYLAFLDLLEHADQGALLQQTFKAATRKFSSSAKVWLKRLAHAQRSGDAAAAQQVLERATTCTPQRKHLKILRQAALQEFKIGSPERGRYIFESLLRNYPKRTDLWSVYIDQEIRTGEALRIRSLFERATALLLPAKKMKFIFKRYLAYERQHGSSETISAVKLAARDYVQQQLAS